MPPSYVATIKDLAHHSFERDISQGLWVNSAVFVFSFAILGFLFQHIENPEWQMRFHWREHSIYPRTTCTRRRDDCRRICEREPTM